MASHPSAVIVVVYIRRLFAKVFKRWTIVFVYIIRKSFNMYYVSVIAIMSIMVADSSCTYAFVLFCSRHFSPISESAQTRFKINWRNKMQMRISPCTHDHVEYHTYFIHVYINVPRASDKHPFPIKKNKIQRTQLSYNKTIKFH